ncbi:hypothetical protein ACFXTO_025904 [Malus domestica]
MISAEVVNIGDEACEVVAGTISTGLLARQHQKVEITLTLLEQGGTAGRKLLAGCCIQHVWIGDRFAALEHI